MGIGSKARIPYRDRSEAGRFLAGELVEYQARPDLLILGLVPGGMQVAAEVATALGAPLGALSVRKLLAPAEPALTMGVVAPGGIQILNQELIRALAVTDEQLRSVLGRESAEAERLHQLFGTRVKDWKDRTLILIDDAAESGWTMLAAATYARKQAPREIVVALPVTTAGALERFRGKTDRCVCPAIREGSSALGSWYWHLPPTTESEVTQLLQGHRPQANE